MGFFLKNNHRNILGGDPRSITSFKFPRRGAFPGNFVNAFHPRGTSGIVKLIFDMKRQFSLTTSIPRVTYDRLFAIDDGCAAKMSGNIFHIPKYVGRQNNTCGKGDDGARVVEWRAWMIQQVRNQNRPSLVSPLLSTAAATTWLDGRFGLLSRCRGLLRTARDDRITWKYGEQRQRTRQRAPFYRKLNLERQPTQRWRHSHWV